MVEVGSEVICQYMRCDCLTKGRPKIWTTFSTKMSLDQSTQTHPTVAQVVSTILPRNPWDKRQWFRWRATHAECATKSARGILSERRYTHKQNKAKRTYNTQISQCRIDMWDTRPQKTHANNQTCHVVRCNSKCEQSNMIPIVVSNIDYHMHWQNVWDKGQLFSLHELRMLNMPWHDWQYMESWQLFVTHCL